MNTKKSNGITAVIITAALAVFVFTACGGAGTDSGQEPAATTETQATVPEQTESNAAQQTSETQAAAAENTVGQDNSGASAGDIGIQQVQTIVLARVPGAAASDIYELERDYDDGRIQYEGSIYFNGYEYEFEVDGATGNILQWEIDD